MLLFTFNFSFGLEKPRLRLSLEILSSFSFIMELLLFYMVIVQKKIFLPQGSGHNFNTTYDKPKPRKSPQLHMC